MTVENQKSDMAIQIGELAAYLTTRYGLRVEDRRAAERLLLARASHHELSIPTYVDWVTSHFGRSEMETLVGELTIPETFFFRSRYHLDALRDRVVPELQSSRSVEAPVRIWSAGCCTGEEPASIVMTLREAGLSPSRYELIATDLHRGYLDEANRRRYRRWKLRNTPQEIVERYFHACSPDEFELDESVTRTIRFAQFNLAADPLPHPALGLDGLDVIFCRNVLMYFEPEARQDTLRRIVSCLKPGGYLFLGDSEWMPGEVFGLQAAPEVAPSTFRRIADNDRNIHRTPRPSSRRQPAVPSECEQELPKGTSDVWTRPDQQEIAPAAPRYETTSAPETGKHRPAIRSRRGALENSHDSAALLRQAGLLADERKFLDAHMLCEKALLLDPYHVPTYVMQAMLALAVEKRSEAIAALRRALYLDPDHLQALFLFATTLVDDPGEQERLASLCRRLLRAVAGYGDEQVVLEEGSITAGYVRRFACEYIDR